MNNLIECKAWKELENLFSDSYTLNLREAFRSDPYRFQKFSVRFKDILLDFSKNLIDYKIFQKLIELAEERNLHDSIEAMFKGEKINTSENRAVLHTALRASSDKSVRTDGRDIIQNIKVVKNQMRHFVDAVHNGSWKGCTGETISDIVNIGIGGSDLGPSLVCHALKPYAKQGINVHFVSNVDGSNINDVLSRLNPAKTLFIIASKTFTTQETLTNANSAKKWFLQKIAKKQEDIAKHFVALSTNEEAVRAFGIDTANMFVFWNWVGGRYSLWSSIGLIIALYIGMDNFDELLAGAEEMDEHFRFTSFDENIPVILALLGIWYVNFFNASTHAVIPYDYYLNELPDYIQQLDMESNGKAVTKDGNHVNYLTGPVIWGKPGTNAQHSFFQLIHQGTQLIPVDFLAHVKNLNSDNIHHDILIANFFAQTEALMKGKTLNEVVSELKSIGTDYLEIEKLKNHKVFEGGKPTNTILYKQLSPRILGSLLAMYEHKVFVQGIIWGINSFDQWGVELGKELAKTILDDIKSENETNSHDCSTNNLINYYKVYKDQD